MAANKMGCFGSPLPDGYYVKSSDYDALEANYFKSNKLLAAAEYRIRELETKGEQG